MTDFIKGMDVSTLIEEERCGAKYYDNGIEKDLLKILSDHGCNSVRLRLWNDPYSETGEEYGAGTNDLDKTITLAKRANSYGMGVLLDFHYSDFWADPGKQIAPKAWKNYTKDEIVKAIFDYTVSVMKVIKAENIKLDMIQVGNEITNGLVWPLGKKTGEKEGFDNIAEFISSGIKGVRAVDKDVPIMLHLDNGGNNPMYVEWFDNYFKRGEDFQIIGLSYYPFWHGTLEALEYNMNDMQKRYGKDIVVAEVSMGFTMDDYAEYEKLGASERKGYATRKELVEGLQYPMTKAGQADFMQDVMTRIRNNPKGKGFYYWEPGWIPVPGCGWANDAALQYTGEKGPGGNEWANQALFDYDGKVNPALEVIKNF